jgi:hypothetical protein
MHIRTPCATYNTNNLIYSYSIGGVYIHLVCFCCTAMPLGASQTGLRSFNFFAVSPRYPNRLQVRKSAT